MGSPKASLGVALLLHACSHANPPQPETELPASVAEQGAVEDEAPASSPAAAAPSTPPPVETPATNVERITGIASCDEYLDLYRRCEKRLEPEIMNGDRRFYRAERAALEHAAGTPERASLPEACAAMLQDLRTACP